MIHNEEKDRYRNNTLVLNYAHEFTDNLKLESNSRIADTYLQYDKEVDTATATHDEEVDGIESSYNMSMTYDYDEKFRGKGAKDMKKDHMKGDVDDTLKLAVKDVSDAGRRGPSPKARSGADKMNVGDKKIMKGGTPTPNQKMESLVQAYKSMKSI